MKTYRKYVLQTRAIQKALFPMKVLWRERSERVHKRINKSGEKYAIDETDKRKRLLQITQSSTNQDI